MMRNHSRRGRQAVLRLCHVATLGRTLTSTASLAGMLALGAVALPATAQARPADGEGAPATESQDNTKVDLGGALTGKARSLHLEGIKHFQEGRLAEARASLAAAWGIKKHYHIAGALGSVELQLKHYRDAAELLHYYMQKAPDSAEKKQTNDNYIKALAQVGRVRLVVQPVDAVVKLDGKVLDKDELLAVFVEPGEHAVEATAAGHQPTKGSFKIAAGEEKKVQLRAKKSDAPPPTEPPPAWIGWTMGGAGVAGIAAGAVLMGLSAGKKSDAEALSATLPLDGCGGSSVSASCIELQDLSKASDSLMTGGVIAMAAGGALVVGGGLYLLLRSTGSKSSDQGKSATRVQLRPLIGRTNGLLLKYRF